MSKSMVTVSLVLKHYPDSTIQLGTSTIKRPSHLKQDPELLITQFHGIFASRIIFRDNFRFRENFRESFCENFRNFS
jgi:hypothetical protein